MNYIFIIITPNIIIIDAITFCIILFLSLLIKYSYTVFNIEVNVRSGAINVTLPSWYALTDDISIKHQVNADIKNFFLS